MSRVLVPVSAVMGLAVLGAAACAPVTSYNGFQAREDKPNATKVGVDTRSTVLAKLGSPTSQSSFGDPTFYYISQTTEREAYLKPRIRAREVTAISFAKDEKVSEVKTYKLTDGYKIAYEGRATPTRGRQVNWIEQILGTIGRGGVMPNQVDPGQTRGAGR